jgi:osmotically-inducible protein OsmY
MSSNGSPSWKLHRGVAAHNGVITLTGNVNSYNKKLVAERAAKRVKGVRSVAMDIEVRLSANGQRTDTEIADAVVSALRWNTAVPDEQITSEVDNGYVTLEGEVAWQFQKDAAANAIKYLIGI